MLCPLSTPLKSDELDPLWRWIGTHVFGQCTHQTVISGNEHKKGSDAGAFGDSTEKKDRRSEEEKQAV